MNNYYPTFSSSQQYEELAYPQGYSPSASGYQYHSSSSPTTPPSATPSIYLLPSRARYLVSKLFEDDYEFMPEISPKYTVVSPSGKFNAFKASPFSPTNLPTVMDAPLHTRETSLESCSTSTEEVPRVHTPRIKRPLEIRHPATGLRVSSAK